MQRIWRLELIYYWRKMLYYMKISDYVWNLCLIQEYYILCDIFMLDTKMNNLQQCTLALYILNFTIKQKTS